MSTETLLDRERLSKERFTRKQIKSSLKPVKNIAAMRDLIEDILGENPIVDVDLQALSQAGLELSLIPIDIDGKIAVKFVCKKKKLELLISKEGNCLLKDLSRAITAMHPPQANSVKPSTPTEDPPGHEEDTDIPEWIDIPDALEKINSLRIASQ